MSNQYVLGYHDALTDTGTSYPKDTLETFNEYQRGFIDGFFERMKRDATAFQANLLKPYVVRLDQKVEAFVHRYVKVLATSEEEALQSAEDGINTQKVSPAIFDETLDLMTETPTIVSPEDQAWEIELKDWA